jgi:hypothetical protein
MDATLILKGGGYGGHSIIAGWIPTHHHWTGTTDESRPAVPPPDGGLPEKPDPYTRMKRWAKYMRTQALKKWRDG